MRGGTLDVGRIQQELRRFAAEREWEQFHTPKNLAMALTGEAGELTEIFQWLEGEESRRIMEDPATAERVREEVADVLIYLIRLADVLGLDLEEAVWRKLTLNHTRYPAERARGHARKYTELEESDEA